MFLIAKVPFWKTSNRGPCLLSAEMVAPTQENKVDIKCCKCVKMIRVIKKQKQKKKQDLNAFVSPCNHCTHFWGSLIDSTQKIRSLVERKKLLAQAKLH